MQKRFVQYRKAGEQGGEGGDTNLNTANDGGGAGSGDTAGTKSGDAQPGTEAKAPTTGFESSASTGNFGREAKKDAKK